MINSNWVNENNTLSETEQLDAEWVMLIWEARQIGLTPDVIRDFLKDGKV